MKPRLLAVGILAAMLTGCGAKPMPEVPIAGDTSAPCASFAPWGFPVSLAEKDAAGNVIKPAAFICRPGLYAIGYDRKLRVPRWVVEMVKPDNRKGSAQKVRKDWRADPLITDAGRVSVDDYDDKFTHGALGVKAFASYKNVIANEIMVSHTFYLSNTAPSIISDDKPGAWERLEDQVVHWSDSKGDLLVLSGPVYLPGMPVAWTGRAPEKSSKTQSGTIAIPTHFYKVVVDLRENEAIAFLVPNNDEPGSKLPGMAVRVADVENITGLRLFPLLSPQQRKSLVESVDTKAWPIEAWSADVK